MIINCPNCGKILVKGFTELDAIVVDFSFLTRCAHCKTDVEMSVKSQMRIERKTSGMRMIRAPGSSPPQRPNDSDSRVYVADN